MNAIRRVITRMEHEIAVRKSRIKHLRRLERLVESTEAAFQRISGGGVAKKAKRAKKSVKHSKNEWTPKQRKAAAARMKAYWAKKKKAAK